MQLYAHVCLTCFLKFIFKRLKTTSIFNNDLFQIEQHDQNNETAHSVYIVRGDYWVHDNGIPLLYSKS